MASRSCRLLAEIRCVVTVIWRTGRSARPAMTQPATTDTTSMTPSATAEPSRYRCERPDCTDTTLVVVPVALDSSLELLDPTLLVMASSSTADSTNRAQYRAVKRIRTVRRDRSVIAVSPSRAATRPIHSGPAPACPAGPYTDITAAVRPL